MCVSFLKNFYNFSITFNVVLRSISGTGKICSVLIFGILELPKTTSTTAFGKLFHYSEQKFSSKIIVTNSF